MKRVVEGRRARLQEGLAYAKIGLLDHAARCLDGDRDRQTGNSDVVRVEEARPGAADHEERSGHGARAKDGVVVRVGNGRPAHGDIDLVAGVDTRGRKSSERPGARSALQQHIAGDVHVELARIELREGKGVARAYAGE